MSDLFPGTFEPSLTCLSIRQPWAWLIVNGYKHIENRNWNYMPTFRGALLIHASQAIDKKAYEFCRKLTEAAIPDPKDMLTGGIVGRVTMTKVVTESPSPWFFGPLGFILTEQKPLPFVKIKGRLGFFKLDEEETTLFVNTMMQSGVPI